MPRKPRTITTEIDPKIVSAAEKRAHQLGISADDLMVSALADYLSRQSRSLDPATRRRLRLLQRKIRKLEEMQWRQGQALAAVIQSLQELSAPPSEEPKKKRIGF